MSRRDDWDDHRYPQPPSWKVTLFLKAMDAIQFVGYLKWRLTRRRRHG